MDWKSRAEGIMSTFFESKKNSNCLLQLEELLLSPDEKCVVATLDVVLKGFSEIFSRGLLTTSCIEKSNEYKLWLFNRYEDFISHLLSYLSHDSKDIQIASLNMLMSFVQLESGNLCRENSKGQVFPYPLFKRIISGLASDILEQQNLIVAFEEYSQYDDIKLYLLKSLQAIFDESNEITDLLLRNCFSLLCSIKFPKSFDSSTSNTFTSQTGMHPFRLKEKSFRKLFFSSWNYFLNWELSPSFLKRILYVLNKNVLPYLHKPCLFTDFLTNAYNTGGVFSLLALQGLFVLMEKHNLEYPDFYVKLYALLDLNIISGKFSAKFFYFTNLFLSSTHLPAHMVAAFAKKLSHLILFSNANSILKIIDLISNLLSNHPSLRVLLHRTSLEVPPEDCFDFSAKDPSKTNALKSSLWEIKSLQSHINPQVCSKVEELIANHPKFTSEIPNNNLFELYKKYCKRKYGHFSLSILKPAKQRRSSISNSL